MLISCGDREVVDGAAVICRVDDAGRFGGEPREILPRGHAAEIVLAQERLQRDRRRHLAGADQPRHDLEDRRCTARKVLGFQEVRHAIEGVVVDQHRADQGLFRLDVVRGDPIGRCIGRGPTRSRIKCCHDQDANVFIGA